jgi:hypothetical protein
MVERQFFKVVPLTCGFGEWPSCGKPRERLRAVPYFERYDAFIDPSSAMGS